MFSPTPPRPDPWRRALVALAIVITVAACGGSPSAQPIGSAGAAPTLAPLASPTAATRPTAAASPTAGASPTAAGSTGAIDPRSEDLATRLLASTYTADTTAATIEILARSGVETFATPDATAPLRASQTTASPLRLLEFQAHALAVGAWSQSGLTGAELDRLLPVTSDAGDQPSISAVLAGYVAATDSPGAALSRALLRGANLLAPGSVHFPTLVIVLFASDVATGGRLASNRGSVVLAAVRQAQPAQARIVVGVPALALGTLCSDTAGFIDRTIHALFEALKVATPSNAVLRVVASIWNWIVSQGERFVRTLVTLVTDAVLGTIRTIAGAIAAVAEQVASFLPYAVAVRTQESTAQGAFDSTVFRLLPDSQLGGQFTATITAGDLPDWPDLLKDCAATAQVALPSFRGRGLPVIWGPIRGSATPFIGGILADGVTDEQGDARWTFLTSVDPGSPTEQEIRAADDMPVTVHRPEVAAARSRLTEVLLAPIPSLLRGFVGTLFAPYINGLQGELNKLLDARGTGHVTIVYHAGLKPTPVAATASPTPTGSPASAKPGIVPDACSLITVAEMGAAVGHPVVGTNKNPGVVNPTIQSSCYFGFGSEFGAIAVAVAKPGTLDGIIRNRATTPLPGVGDRAYTWIFSKSAYAGAMVGDVAVTVTFSTDYYPAAAAARILKIAVSRL